MNLTEIVAGLLAVTAAVALVRAVIAAAELAGKTDCVLQVRDGVLVER